jgi:hypothetical protein
MPAIHLRRRRLGLRIPRQRVRGDVELRNLPVGRVVHGGGLHQDVRHANVPLTGALEPCDVRVRGLRVRRGDGRREDSLRRLQVTRPLEGSCSPIQPGLFTPAGDVA